MAQPPWDESAGADARKAPQRDRPRRGRWQARKVRRPGSSAPLGSLRPTTTLGRRTFSLLLPPWCSPENKNPFPFSGLPPWSSPSVRPSPMGCCTDGRYSAQPPSQPGPLWVAIRLPRPESCAEFRHKWAAGPLPLPGGDCAPSVWGGRYRCERRGSQRGVGGSAACRPSRRERISARVVIRKPDSDLAFGPDARARVDRCRRAISAPQAPERWRMHALGWPLATTSVQGSP
jgi:hypothetical protein